jgi:hypothetical protein
VKKTYRAYAPAPLSSWVLALCLPGALCLPSGCNKEATPANAPAPAAAPIPAAPPTKPTAPTPTRSAPTPTPPAPAQPTAAAAAPASGEKEEEATVLKVSKLRGGRTIFTSSGVQHIEGTPSYEVQVGLTDGTRIAFYPLQNKLQEGSKVVVQYLLKDGQLTRPALPVATPVENGRIVAEVLPLLKPAPVGDGTFSITFPAPPSEDKTDLGILYRYQYKFSKSYQPDSYHFFRTNAEGSGKQPFFKEQALSLLTLGGGKRIAVRISGPKRDKKTGLIKATGAFTVEFNYIPQDGLIQLWYDAKQKVIYGAWVNAYSPNRLAAEPEMKRSFFGSFSVK